MSDNTKDKQEETEEEIIWSGIANTKCLCLDTLFFLGIIVLAAIVVNIIAAYRPAGYLTAATVLLWIGSFILLIVWSVSFGHRRPYGNTVITNMALRYSRNALNYYYPYSDIFVVTKYRSFADFLGGTESIRIKCMHTYSRPDGFVYKKKIGYIKLYCLYDADTAFKLLDKLSAEAKAIPGTETAGAIKYE